MRLTGRYMIYEITATKEEIKGTQADLAKLGMAKDEHYQVRQASSNSCYWIIETWNPIVAGHMDREFGINR